MASPRLRATPLPAARSPPLIAAPGAATPAKVSEALGDETIWKRLREAGFDEESVKRRDKTALIAYITKIETEIYDLQYHMGLFLLEKKEWESRYEQAKDAADLAELAYKREQAARFSALAEAMKREESLKKSLSIEKECVANIEKALHDLRAESAERKLNCESKLSQARAMAEEAQKKLDESESKLHEAQLLHSEATRSRDSALRKLQDVEAREDDIRRRLNSLNSISDAKEKEIYDLRQSLFDRQKVLHQEQERLHEGQNLLNQRETFIFERSRALSISEKELEEAKVTFEDERRILKEERSNLDLDKAALLTREEGVVQRESLHEKRERELLVLQEKVANKEYDELQRISDEHYFTLDKRRGEIEAEIERRRIVFEEEMKARTAAFDAMEDDLNQREKLIDERDHTLEVRLLQLAEQQEDLGNKLKMLEEREKTLQSIEKERESEMLKLHLEREHIRELKEDFERLQVAVEDEKGKVALEQGKLMLTENERRELYVLKVKLKEEIDSIRAQKMELLNEANRLKAEKDKFETEWEFIDEKREELRKEAQKASEERKAISSFLKSEYDNIKLERETLHNQFKSDVESLAREREEFVGKMEREHSAWFQKMQQEREHFMQDIKIQRKDLKTCIDKRRQEIEAYLKEKENAFEQEKASEVQHINSQKELVAKELERISAEVRRLENENAEIALDREQREREWSEIKNSIEALDIQREKLQKQRELLSLDREEINQQIQRLKRLEELEIVSENWALSDLKSHYVKPNALKSPIIQLSNMRHITDDDDDCRHAQVSGDGYLAPEILLDKIKDRVSPPKLATSTWLRKCADVLFKRSPDKGSANFVENIEAKSATKSVGVSERNIMSPRDNERAPKLLGSVNSSPSQRKVQVKGMERTGRHAYGKVSNLNPNLESSYENAKVVHKVEHRNRHNVAQIKDDAAWDLIKNGFRSSLLGRKRIADTLPHDDSDVESDLNQKLRKRMRHDEGNGIVEITSDRPLLEIHENGNQHNAEASLHVENGVPRKQGSREDEVSFEAEARKNNNALDTKAISEKNVERIEEQDGSDEDSDDESEDDEEPTSLKAKFWNFMFT